MYVTIKQIIPGTGYDIWQTNFGSIYLEPGCAGGVGDTVEVIQSSHPERWITQPQSPSALRYNQGKPDWTLVHMESLIPMIQVLEFGKNKYTRDNWRKPMDRNTILASAQRHLAALIDGEENDPESGLPHIGHLMANFMFYSWHITGKKDLPTL